MRNVAASLFALICMMAPAVAQAPDAVLTPEGRPTGEWKEDQICVGPKRECRPAIRSRETGEIAMYDGRITQGFRLTGQGQELVRGSAVRLNGRSIIAPRDSIVLDAAGKFVSPWKEVRVCEGGPKECPTLIVHGQTSEIAKYNDRWAAGFRPSGNGLEVTRTSSSN